MMPECMLQNIAQPHRNATAGENISRRNTYTPPVRGIADDSSAQMLAPNQVSAPATTQTSSIPPNDGTARLTSDGCTKIDEPTIVPTTIAVACVSPMVRRRGREPFSAVRVGSGTVSAIQPVVSRSSDSNEGSRPGENPFPPPVEIGKRFRPPVDADPITGPAAARRWS